MTKVDTILSRMDGIHKSRIKFMTSHIETLGSFQGRANLINLHRYGAPHPRTTFRWSQRDFDYLECNKRAIESAGILKNDLALAIDATFLRKSEKKTHGVGYFHNGCSNKQERGLDSLK